MITWSLRGHVMFDSNIVQDDASVLSHRCHASSLPALYRTVCKILCVGDFVSVPSFPFFHYALTIQPPTHGVCTPTTDLVFTAELSFDIFPKDNVMVKFESNLRQQ